MMHPTNQLRFVAREAMFYGDIMFVNVLQQLWVSDFEGEPDEWRDVPLVQEKQ